VLDEPEGLPLEPSDAVDQLGRILVVAPHPDDDTLGCGGLIALARQRGAAVRVLFVTDGAASHPGSRRYPPPRLRAVRESEARAALSVLGAAPRTACFFRWPDGGGVPRRGMPKFAAAVRRCRVALDEFQADTAILPWRREPHPDHRHAAALARAALRQSAHPAPRILEYPIWAWEQGGRPRPGEVQAWRLDIAAVRSRKLAAIAMHRSQVGELVGDDPTGFRLSPTMLALFARPWELFFDAPGFARPS
jgi:LmbE family N-acetylglucosaminyl deacetylase